MRFADGSERSSCGGPICFIISTLRQLGHETQASAGSSWVTFPSLGDGEAAPSCEEIQKRLGAMALLLSFDEQDTTRPPSAVLPPGSGNLDPFLTSLPKNVSTLVISSIFPDVTLQALRAVRACSHLKLVLDLQGFQRCLTPTGEIVRQPADPEIVGLAHVLKGNRAEVERQYGAEAEQTLAQIASARGTVFLITEGARGAVLIDGAREPIFVPADARHGVSSVGAGDRLLGAFVHYMECGYPAVEALARGQGWVREHLEPLQ